jgi:hypothetical protein
MDNIGPQGKCEGRRTNNQSTPFDGTKKNHVCMDIVVHFVASQYSNHGCENLISTLVNHWCK